MADPPMPDERTIFLEAVEISSARDRDAYLDAACAGDAVLREKVEALLRAHDRSLGLIDAPDAAAPTAERPSSPERPGTMIGPYKLLEEIGEGGMGVVYMAEQSRPVRRRVALKVIKPGMDTRQVIARFEAERQALALMDHANIARIFDGGITESGRPYFVMELVKGLPITEFCDRNRLTPRQRVELFVAVCQAVQHAHQKGIIHRDLKPSNVLVSEHDATPVVKIIDFGVAKALGQELTDKTLFTGFAQAVGTPLYMSPEQAGQGGLDVDTRSDVYALGVLLYELLTGTTPFDRERFRKAAHEEILRIVREEDPPRPSTRLSESGAALPSISALRRTEPARLARLVRGELDWVVMKCLEKDRNRRYESANGLAADIRRFLDDEPVAACPPSAGYRVRKFASRNRGPLFVGAAIALATIGLIAAVTWTAWDRHTRSIQQANARSARAAVLSAQLQGILSDIARLEEQQAWPEAVAAARRAETAIAVGEGGPEAVATVRRHVAELRFAERLDAARSLREVDAGPTNAAAAERAYNEAFAAFGVNLADPSAASDRLRQAPGIVKAVAAALDDWAAVRRDNAHPGAKGLTELALAIDDDPFRREIRRAILDRSEDTLRRLGREVPKTRQPAATLWLLGIAQPTADERAQSLLRAQVEYPADFWINVHLGWNLLGCQPSQQDRAVRFFQAALAVRPTSRVRAHLGHTLVRMNRGEEAEAVIRKGLSLSPRDASAHWALGHLYHWQRKFDAALAEQRKAVELDPRLPGPYVDMAITLIIIGRNGEAIEACRKAIEIDPKSTWGYIHLGSALRMVGRYGESLAAYEKAQRLDPDAPVLAREIGNTVEARSGLDGLIAHRLREIERDPRDWKAPLYLGVALARKGRLDQGLSYLEKAISLNPTDRAELALAHYQLGELLNNQGHLDEAIVLIRKGFEIQPGYELNPKDLANARVVLGNALGKQGNLGEAVAEYQKAAEIEPRDARVRAILGDALQRQGKLGEAIASCRRAIELDAADILAYVLLGRALHREGEATEAISWLDRATEVDPLDPKCRNQLAWCLATAIPAKIRDPARAVRLAREAVALVPEESNYWNTLGIALIRAGDPKAAVIALEKSMALRRGGDGFDWFFLAMAHGRLGDRAKAQSFYDRAVAWTDKNASDVGALVRFGVDVHQIDREALNSQRPAQGEGRPQALGASDLGALFTDAGRFAEVEALHMKKLETLRRDLGAEHTHTLGFMNRLAIAYQQNGRLDVAEALFAQVLELDRRVLGEDDRNTLIAEFNLAGLYLARGQSRKGEPLLIKLLETVHRISGEEDTLALSCLGKLGDLYRAQKRLSEAEPLLARALETRRRVLGDRNPDTLFSMNDLALLYAAQDLPDKAESLFVEALTGLGEVLGKAHRETRNCTANLLGLYQARGQFAKAEPLLTAILDDARGNAPSESPEVANALAALGLNLLLQKNYDEAERLLRECLKIRDEKEPGAWTTFNARSLLGDCLLGRGQFTEAEPLLLAGYDGMKQRESNIPAAGKVRLTEALERLARLYERWDQPEKAAEWRKKLAANAPDRKS